MSYSEFLFSQLFMEHVDKVGLGDIEYDLIYPDVVRHYKLFTKSSFNVDIRSEYDCMVDYLNNYIK